MRATEWDRWLMLNVEMVFKMRIKWNKVSKEEMVKSSNGSAFGIRKGFPIAGNCQNGQRIKNTLPFSASFFAMALGILPGTEENVDKTKKARVKRLKLVNKKTTKIPHTDVSSENATTTLHLPLFGLASTISDYVEMNFCYICVSFFLFFSVCCRSLALGSIFFE